MTTGAYIRHIDFATDEQERECRRISQAIRALTSDHCSVDMVVMSEAAQMCHDAGLTKEQAQARFGNCLFLVYAGQDLMAQINSTPSTEGTKESSILDLLWRREEKAP